MIIVRGRERVSFVSCCFGWVCRRLSSCWCRLAALTEMPSEMGFAKQVHKYFGATAKWATELLSLSFAKLKTCLYFSSDSVHTVLGYYPFFCPSREKIHMWLNLEGGHHSDDSWDHNSPIQEDVSTFPWTGWLCVSLPWHMAHWEPAAELRRMKQEGNTGHKRLPWASHLERYIKLKSAVNVISLFILS